MQIEIDFTCCLCSESHKTTVELPDTWAMRYESIDAENSFCPKHAKIAEWAQAQCPGCVGGWADCDLWRAFAYRERRTLTEPDFDSIRCGICPKRTNGTMAFSREKGMEEINLSETAPTDAGECFAQAIKDYWAKYV